MKAIVSEKGQVTLPKPLRDRLGIRPGQVLELNEKEGKIWVAKASREDPVERVYGILEKEMDTDAFMESIRGKADVD